MMHDWADDLAELICHEDISAETRKTVVANCLREQRAFGELLGRLEAMTPKARKRAEVVERMGWPL